MEGRLHTTDFRTFQIFGDDSSCLATCTNESIGHVLSGDRVRLSATGRWECAVRGPHPWLAGRLEIASKTTYGKTSRGVPLYLFLPFRKEYPPMIVGCHTTDRQNLLVLVEFDSWSDDPSALPRGVLRQVLGVCGHLDSERSALLWTHSPWKTPRCPTTAIPPLSVTREEAPTLTFSIDPPGCQDVDDALSVAILEGGSMELWISIADVASVIPAGSALDLGAKQVAQTTYANGFPVRSMLPTEYSEHDCSLLAHQERPALSLVLLFHEGVCLEKRWVRSTLVNLRQYTYESISTEGPADGIPLDALLPLFASLGADVSDSHSWVEACMLEYNKEAAEMLVRHGGGVLRRQRPHTEVRFKQYEEIYPGLGQLAKHAAEYCAPTDVETAHSELGVAAYCHATSPIRRYADLVNQRALHAILDKRTDVQVSPTTLTWLNARSRDIKRYERDLAFLEMVASETTTGRIRMCVVDCQKKDTAWKIRFWVPAWSRIVSSRLPQPLDPGWDGAVEFHMNLENRFWKDRLVLRPL